MNILKVDPQTVSADEVLSAEVVHAEVDSEEFITVYCSDGYYFILTRAEFEIIRNAK